MQFSSAIIVTNFTFLFIFTKIKVQKMDPQSAYVAFYFYSRLDPLRFYLNESLPEGSAVLRIDTVGAARGIKQRTALYFREAATTSVSWTVKKRTTAHLVEQL